MTAHHNWPGTRDHLRLVPKSDAEIEAEVIDIRSKFDEYAVPFRTRHSDGMRLAPLRQRIPVGGGWMRKALDWLRKPVLTVSMKGDDK